jgi:hypothetical protein
MERSAVGGGPGEPVAARRRRGSASAPIAPGRQNGLFAVSLCAGKRAAAVMSLIPSAKLDGLDPYAHRLDAAERLPRR